MDSLLFSRSRGLWVSVSVLCGALLGACGSEASPDVDKSDQDSQSSDDDDDDDTSSKKDAGSKKDTGTSTTPKKDASTSGAASDAGAKKDSSVAKDSGTVKAGSGGLPCDVKKIVTEACGTCHGASTAAGAPMSLVTAADFQAPAATDETKKVLDVVKTRINAKSKPMPPPPADPLAGDVLGTLNDWLDQGAPASEETCSETTKPGDDNGENIDVSGLDCYKFLAHAQGSKTGKFKLGSAVDRYVNFGFQAPWQGTMYGKVVRPIIDNAKVLHHWLLYKEPVGDGSITDTIGQHGGGELIHGWAPGGIPMDFSKHPDDVGFELPASTYSVEVHYNSNDPSAEDASGVEVCGVKTQTKNVAALSWLGYDNGGTISYATGICAPLDEWTGTCVPQSREPIHILFMVPHLHQTGKNLKAIINGLNGPRTLIDKPFDFNYQVSYETDEVLMPGETITTTCNFTAPNCAGQSTSQEMCYLFTYAYPKYALADNGPEGTLMHGKGVCLGQ